ncbi:hypothetical protein B0H19DRAFT_927707, partial [Mycena capillaripes]
MDSNSLQHPKERQFTFEFQCSVGEAADVLFCHKGCISSCVPIRHLSSNLTKAELLQISKLHGFRVPLKMPAAEVRAAFHDHQCARCEDYVSIFADATPLYLRNDEHGTSLKLKQQKKPSRKIITVKSAARQFTEAQRARILARTLRMKRKKYTGSLKHTTFPPKPLSDLEKHSIISRHCETFRPANFVEHGCAVCGLLTPRKALSPLSSFLGNLDLLVASGVTRKERFNLNDLIEDLDGPVLAEGCTRICVECETGLNNNIVPKLALARHNWVGEIPDQLKGLTYAEGIMIARVRHNRCVIRVNSGRVRMSANAIMFTQPVLSVY